MKQNETYVAELNHPGLYKATNGGDEYLLRVLGQKPFLQITHIFNMTSFLKTGEFDAYDYDSQEHVRNNIQNNPEQWSYCPLNHNAIMKIKEDKKSKVVPNVEIDNNLVTQVVDLLSTSDTVTARLFLTIDKGYPIEHAQIILNAAESRIKHRKIQG